MSAAAMARLVVRQSIGDRVTDVKETLTSWDRCMSRNFCKWPVIIAIVIVSLIVLSLLFCLFRCLCCGAECACCCFRCCASCCPSPSRKKSHQRVPSNSNSYQRAPTSAPYHVAPAPVYERPQYARFENTPKNDDALPPMPSWSEATSYRVEDQTPQPHQDVEMKPLDNKAAIAPVVTPMRTPGSMNSPTRDNYGVPGQNNPYVSQHENTSYTGSGRYYGQETGVHSVSPVHGYGGRQTDEYGYRGTASPPPQYQQQHHPEPQWQSQQSTGAQNDGYESYRPYGAAYEGAGRGPNNSYRDV